MRTTLKDATRHTPFSLVYGSEAVLPVEIGIPSTRIAYYSYEENDAEKGQSGPTPRNKRKCLVTFISTEVEEDPPVQQNGQAQTITTS